MNKINELQLNKQKLIDERKMLYIKQNEINKNLEVIEKELNSIFINGCIENNIEIIKKTRPNNSKIADEGFFKACRYGNINVVKYLMEKVLPDDDPRFYAKALEEYASYGKSIKVVKLLLKKKLEKTYIGFALNNACKKKRLKIAKILLKKYGKTDYGVHYAYINQHRKLIKVFKKANPDISYDFVMEQVCEHGNLKTVKKINKKLEKLNLNISYEDYYYRSCINGNFKIIKFICNQLKTKSYSDLDDDTIFTISDGIEHLNKIKILKFIIERSNSINNRYESGKGYNDIKKLKFLRKLGREIFDLLLDESIKKNNKNMIMMICKNNKKYEKKYSKIIDEIKEKVIKVKLVNNKNIKKRINKYIGNVIL